MKQHETTGKMVKGAVAGLAGTLVIQGLQMAGQKTVPEEMPPLKRDPGEFMVEKAEDRLLSGETKEKLPRQVEKGAAYLLSLGYGLTFGGIFALSRRRVRRVVAEGTALGIVTWAAGYLGWLPAMGLLPPITKQKPGQVVGAIASHIIYGITTAATFRLVNRRA